VNCKQKVIFIQCSQRVLYVHARRVLSIIRAWFLFYVKHVLQYVNGHAGLSGFREFFFRNQPIRKKNSLWWPCLLMHRDEMSNLGRGFSIEASYKVVVHLAQWFQRRFFRNRPIRNKNSLWRSCLLTNRDEISHLDRGPSKDASYQITVHLAKRFQRTRFFRNQPIRNKNCLWRHVC
jgi:hypothetical protein